MSALAIVIGWEAMVVLRDIRGLDTDAETKCVTWAARALVDAMLAEANNPDLTSPGIDVDKHNATTSPDAPSAKQDAPRGPSDL